MFSTNLHTYITEPDVFFCPVQEKLDPEKCEFYYELPKKTNKSWL